MSSQEGDTLRQIEKFPWFLVDRAKSRSTSAEHTKRLSLTVEV